MPLPSRQDELYEKVCSDLRGRFVPGSILPGEPEYAKELGCGRTTLRKVLARLAEEGKISRTHSGTKVLKTDSSAQTTEKRPVFLLVPCSEYMEKNRLNKFAGTAPVYFRSNARCNRERKTAGDTSDLRIKPG